MRRLAAGVLLLALWMIGVRFLLGTPRLVVEVAMASDAAGTAQLFVNDGAGFREALSARARVPGGGPANLRFSMPVRGDVHALRLDPVNAPGRLSIDAIAVELGGERRLFRGAALAGWRADHQLTTEDADPADGLVFTSRGKDPRLVLAEPWEVPAVWARLPKGREIALGLGAAWLLVLGLAPSGAPRRRGLGSALALAPPLLFFSAFSLEALGDWWIRDDPCLLRSTLEHGPMSHFIDPAVWRSLSGSVLMPWTPLSFATDHALFGLEPAAFYAHQLLAFVVLLALGYALLRRAGTFAASLALSLFALSPPAYAVARQLMNRHYLEGTILVLLALMFFRRAVEHQDRLAGPLGAALYFLAASAKEVFVPLAAVLPFLPVGEPRARWRAALPYFVAAALYVPWRFYMLGFDNAFSGYEGRERSSVLTALAALPAQFGLGGFEVGLATLVAVAALVWLARCARRWLAFTGVLAVMMALPLLPILGELGPRHFFLPSLALAMLLGSACASLGRFRAAVGSILLLGVLGALADSPIWRHHSEAAALYETEGRFVLEGDAPGLLMSQLADTQYLRCAAELRRMVQRAPGPGYCGDPCFCAGAFPDQPSWRAALGEVVAFEFTPPEDCAAREKPEVNVSYDHQAGRFEWSFGLSEEGSWSLLVLDEATPGSSPPAPLAASGEAPLTIDSKWRFVVRHESPDGRYSYSDVLEIDPI